MSVHVCTFSEKNPPQPPPVLGPLLPATPNHPRQKHSTHRLKLWQLSLVSQQELTQAAADRIEVRMPVVEDLTRRDASGRVPSCTLRSGPAVASARQRRQWGCRADQQ